MSEWKIREKLQKKKNRWTKEEKKSYAGKYCATKHMKRPDKIFFIIQVTLSRLNVGTIRPRTENCSPAFYAEILHLRSF